VGLGFGVGVHPGGLEGSRTGLRVGEFHRVRPCRGGDFDLTVGNVPFSSVVLADWAHSQAGLRCITISWSSRWI
jgi:hypothetical protein